jgi:hypothetical protein
MRELQKTTNHKILEYKGKWIEHVDRMGSDRVQKGILKYQPKGKKFGITCGMIERVCFVVSITVGGVDRIHLVQDR